MTIRSFHTNKKNSSFQENYGSVPNLEPVQLKAPSIIWNLTKLFKFDIGTAMFVKCLSDLLTFANPVLLK